MHVRHLTFFMLAACGPGTAELAGTCECTPPADGAGQQLAGPTPGNTSSSTPGLVWVDAEGAVVDRIVSLPAGVSNSSTGLNYVDDDGYFWPLDPRASGSEAFVPSVAPYGVIAPTGLLHIVFADADCTDPLVQTVSVLERTVMVATYGDTEVPGYGGRAFVVPDGFTPQRIEPSYSLDESGTCNDTTSSADARLEDLVEVEPPSPMWAAPLHPEWR